MAASIIAPMAMAMPPRLMMLEPSPISFMAPKAIRMPTGSIRMATSALLHVQEEHDAHERDDDALLDQRALERLDGIVDQLGAVVDGDDLGALRQAGGDLGQARLDVVDHVQRVGAEPLQDDAARDLALAVQLGDAAALVRPELDPRDIADADGTPASVFRTMASMSWMLLR